MAHRGTGRRGGRGRGFVVNNGVEIEIDNHNHEMEELRQQVATLMAMVQFLLVHCRVMVRPRNLKVTLTTCLVIRIGVGHIPLSFLISGENNFPSSMEALTWMNLLIG